MSDFDFGSFDATDFGLYSSKPGRGGYRSIQTRKLPSDESDVVQLMIGLLAVITAYLIGGIPFGLIVVRVMTGVRCAIFGFGNIGATNVLRTTGPLAGS